MIKCRHITFILNKLKLMAHLIKVVSLIFYKVNIGNQQYPYRN